MITYRDDELWEAVGARDLPAVRRAIASGGDVNLVCPDSWVRDEVAGKRGTGRSLLHHAAWAGDLSVFRALVAARADVGRRRTVAWRPNGGVRGRGSTPLHHAVMYNRKPIVEYLLGECGVDVDEPGEQGYTALHLAAKFDYPDLAEMLLKAGARADLITRDEKTARDLAKGQQDRSHAQVGKVLQLLERYDAGGAKRPRGLPGAPRPRLATGSPPHPEAAPTPAAAPAQSSMASSSSRAIPTLASTGAEEDALDLALRMHSSGSSPTLRTSLIHDGLQSSVTPGAQGKSGDRGGGQGRGAYHDPTGASQNVGNHVGTRSSVRQSKLFRMYESGNATKALLGQEALQWNVAEKEGAYDGPAFDAFSGQRYSGAGDGREVVGRSTRSLVPGSVGSGGPGALRALRRCDSLNRGGRWSTSSSAYGASAAMQARA